MKERFLSSERPRADLTDDLELRNDPEGSSVRRNPLSREPMFMHPDTGDLPSGPFDVPPSREGGALAVPADELDTRVDRKLATASRMPLERGSSPVAKITLERQVVPTPKEGTQVVLSRPGAHERGTQLDRKAIARLREFPRTAIHPPAPVEKVVPIPPETDKEKPPSGNFWDKVRRLFSP